MKKLLSAVLIATTLNTTACSAAWWQTLVSNPAQYIDGFLTQVNTYISTATVIFNALIPLLSIDKQPTVRQDFATAVAAVQHAVTALKDAETAAAAAQQSTPDFTSLVNALVDAVSQCQAIVAEFQPSGGATSGITGFAELQAASDSIAKYKH